MTKLFDLREQRSIKVAEMRGLIDTAEKAGRDLADNERQHFEVLKNETVALDTRISQAETLAELERRADAEPVTDHSLAGLERRVSVLNVIKASMEQRALTGAEAEYNAETARRLGRSAQGTYVPLVALEKRVNLTSTAPETVPLEHRPDQFIGPFRELLVARQLGARVLRVIGLHRWPIILADEDHQGGWSWGCGASAAGARSKLRTG